MIIIGESHVDHVGDETRLHGSFRLESPPAEKHLSGDYFEKATKFSNCQCWVETMFTFTKKSLI